MSVIEVAAVVVAAAEAAALEEEEQILAQARPLAEQQGHDCHQHR